MSRIFCVTFPVYRKVRRPCGLRTIFQKLAFDADGLLLRKLRRVLLGYVQLEDTVFKLCLDLFLGDIVAYVEASLHGA